MVERFLAGARDDRLLAAGREKPPQADKHPGVVVDHEQPRHRRPPATLDGSIDTDRTSAAIGGTAADGRLPVSPASVDPYQPYMAVSLMLATVLRAMGVKPRIVGDSAVMRRLLHVVACIGPRTSRSWCAVRGTASSRSWRTQQAD